MENKLNKTKKLLLFQSLRFQAKAFTHTCKNNTNGFCSFYFSRRPTALKLATLRIHGVLWCPMPHIRTMRTFRKLRAYFFLGTFSLFELRRNRCEPNRAIIYEY